MSHEKNFTSSGSPKNASRGAELFEVRQRDADINVAMAITNPAIVQQYRCRITSAYRIGS
jgi:hypothetical protein